MLKNVFGQRGELAGDVFLGNFDVYSIKFFWIYDFLRTRRPELGAEKAAHLG